MNDWNIFQDVCYWWFFRTQQQRQTKTNLYTIETCNIMLDISSKISTTIVTISIISLWNNYIPEFYKTTSNTCKLNSGGPELVLKIHKVKIHLNNTVYFILTWFTSTILSHGCTMGVKSELWRPGDGCHRWHRNRCR